MAQAVKRFSLRCIFLSALVLKLLSALVYAAPFSGVWVLIITKSLITKGAVFFVTAGFTLYCKLVQRRLTGSLMGLLGAIFALGYASGSLAGGIWGQQVYGSW